MRGENSRSSPDASINSPSEGLQPAGLSINIFINNSLGVPDPTLKDNSHVSSKTDNSLESYWSSHKILFPDNILASLEITWPFWSEDCDCSVLCSESLLPLR